jgi:sec-independent protein translocase protein TatB
MFDIGWGELVVIGIVALIAIGPKELPGVMRTIGFWMGKVRRMANEFQGQFQEALREAELADLKKQAEDFKDSVTSATSFDPLADIDNDGVTSTSKVEPARLDAPGETSGTSPTAQPQPAPPPETEALPEPSVAVSESELAPAEHAPKQAGGKG